MRQIPRIARVLLLIGTTVAAGSLAACQNPNQNRYSYQDVGRASVVEFGTVVAVRQVDITGRNTGLGAGVGGAAGGIAGSTIGRGSGNAAAVLGGVVIGAIAGAVVEQAMADRTGLEYTVTLSNGKTITIVQEQGPSDRVLAPGERVMIQASGTYQRVLPADHLPTEISRPKGIKVTD